MATSATIGWIGAGKMGQPMCANLARAGFPVAVFNRDPQKAEPLTALGVKQAASIAEAANGADFIVSMISDDAALKSVALGAAGVLANARAGATFIDMSTVSPAASREVASAAIEHDVSYLRAPVSGSVVLATDAKLTVVCSGPREAYEASLPLFQAVSAGQTYVGDGEDARVIKLALNMLVGITAAMTGEALAFAGKAGVDRDVFLDVLGRSVVGSPLIQYKIEALRHRDFTPTFATGQMAKDFDLLLDAARELESPLPLAAVVRQGWSALMAGGDRDSDFFKITALAESLAGAGTPSTDGT